MKLRLSVFIKNKLLKLIIKKLNNIRKIIIMKFKISKYKINQPCKIMKMSKVYMINLLKIVKWLKKGKIKLIRKVL